MELQERLVSLRNQSQLSQEALAEKLYVSCQTISNWERRKTYPDINSLLLIAAYFDVSLDYLIKGDVDMMRKQVDKKKIVQMLLLLALSSFLLGLIGNALQQFTGRNERLLGSLFLIVYLALLFLFLKLLKTYRDILAFLQDKKVKQSNFGDELVSLAIFTLVTDIFGWCYGFLPFLVISRAFGLFFMTLY